jgi:hypothetical protein
VNVRKVVLGLKKPAFGTAWGFDFAAKKVILSSTLKAKRGIFFASVRRLP